MKVDEKRLRMWKKKGEWGEGCGRSGEVEDRRRKWGRESRTVGEGREEVEREKEGGE